MNERDEELARSIDPEAWRKIHKDDEDWCQQFADLIRADEREACAKVCEELDAEYEAVCQMTSVMCGQAIRARGQA